MVKRGQEDQGRAQLPRLHFPGRVLQGRGLEVMAIDLVCPQSRAERGGYVTISSVVGSTRTVVSEVLIAGCKEGLPAFH